MTAPAPLPSFGTLTMRLCAPCSPRQAISLPPVGARKGAAEMVVWLLFGKCDPLQGAQVQCQGGSTILNPFGDELPRQILADGARTMLFTWGKVRIGHMASACRQLLQPLCAFPARVSLPIHAIYVSEGSGPAVPSPAGGPPAAGSSFAGRSDLFFAIVLILINTVVKGGHLVLS